VLMEDPRIIAMAKRLGKSVAQLLIRYQIDKGRVVIPKSANPQRLQENWDSLAFHLTPADVVELDAMDRNERLVFPPWMPTVPHPMND